MKNEVKPGIVIAIIAVVVLGAAGFFMIAGNGPSVGGPDKIDIKTIDPAILRDENPKRPGQPGYKERTTDK
ncbi:MAG: hypothetical protein ACO1SV_22590 [Fimbriimonas sp.]